MLINLCSWSKTLAGPWIIAAAVVSAQVPMDNDELSRHLTTVRSQIENTSLNLPRREELALEMAGTLDRAAQLSANPEERRRHWSEAIELLDWFLKQNPDPPRTADSVSSGGLSLGTGAKLDRCESAGPDRSVAAQ